VLPDLCALLERVDPTPDSPRDCGVVDWADLGGQLHFILEMFRCHHEGAALFAPPFTADQVAALKAGRLPEGVCRKSRGRGWVGEVDKRSSMSGLFLCRLPRDPPES